MKVLQLCPKPPLPAIDGGCLASFELSRLLQFTQNDLQVISLATEKHPYLRSEMDEEFVRNTNFKAFDIKTQLTVGGVIRNLFGRKSLHESRFYDKRFSEFLKQHFKNHEYDIIILDGLMSCCYLNTVRKGSTAKIVYRSHNIEHSLLEQRSKNESNILKKLYLQQQSNRLHFFEWEVWKAVDEIWSISETDSKVIEKEIESDNKISHLRFSMDASGNMKSPTPKTIFHLGAMDWKPNIDGVMWFVKKVWPKVLIEIPEAEFHLGGKDISLVENDLKSDGIYIHKNVQNASEFYNKYEVMVVPIHTGSGLRIKIVQALAAGKAIISTATGMKGMPGIIGQDYEVTGDENEMSTKIIELLRDKERIKKLEENAEKLFNSNFETSIVAESLKELLRK